MVMVAMTIFTSVAVAQTPITTIEELNSVRNDLTGSYVLMNDLDFAEDDSYDDATANKTAYRPLNNADPAAVGAAVVSDPADGLNPGFTPIGDNSDDTNATRFTGTFDGKGFTISNLYINRGSTNDTGLFGYISNSSVGSVRLVDAYVRGNNDVGGLAGNNSGSTIENCSVTGTIRGTNTVGGLVGENFDTIRNCYTTGNTSGNVSIGGLVGDNSGTIENCYATGNSLRIRQSSRRTRGSE